METILITVNIILAIILYIIPIIFHSFTFKLQEKGNLKIFFWIKD